MLTTSIQSTDVDVELSPYPLPPEAILAGDPRPRGRVVCRLETDSSRLVSGIFTAEPGTIRSRVSSTETIHVLEGSVSIELSGGPSVALGPGDVAVIPPGQDAKWTFHSHFREVFVLTS